MFVCAVDVVCAGMDNGSIMYCIEVTQCECMATQQSMLRVQGMDNGSIMYCIEVTNVMYAHPTVDAVCSVDVACASMDNGSIMYCIEVTNVNVCPPNSRCCVCRYGQWVHNVFIEVTNVNVCHPTVDVVCSGMDNGSIMYCIEVTNVNVWPPNSRCCVCRYGQWVHLQHQRVPRGASAIPQRLHACAHHHYSLFVTCLMVLIVIGNMLVCIAIATEKNLKTVQNWFIASLAVSDFLVGLLIMPFSLANELMG
ncbi:ADRA2B [Cordylochernes scorpioides]|uniref:ADRA2B n=1 Tax=Cordylochernes scorpioides TaxID=51811 RepID=A0ABY6KST1_9ARAC|nr:ADRA2B [Cordylochernes scorpioides]